MDVSKIIRGIVNSRGYTITSAITQWDYGYVFVPEFDDMPATYRLDFSNDEHHGTALPVYCGAEGGEVPEELIDTGKDVWVWLFNIGEGYGITEYKWRIPNKCKPKTEQDEPTPSQQSSIDQLIVRSNEAVESAEQSAEQAEQAKNTTEAYANTAHGYAEQASASATASANSALASAQRASASEQSASASANSALASAQSASQAQGYAQTASAKADSITRLTATATTLPDGSSATASYDAETGVMSFGIPKGKDGTNGDDGYSPTASVSKSGKTATITITDKTGTTSAQVEDGTDGISPTVTITPITGGHRITITDADGTETADVMDGHNGMVTVNVSGTTPTITAQADYRYVCGEVATLDFTPSATGICDVVFTSGSTPTVVTLPSTVKFPDGSFTAEADTTYEINILDGIYGAVMAWT